jgi:hypothetical protein
MPGSDLDDFELERTPHTPRDEPERTLAAEAPFENELSLPADGREGAGRLFLPTLVALALIALGVLVLLFVVFRQPVKPKPAEAVAATEAAPARPVPSAAAPVPAAPLPGLDESDEYVRRAAASLSSRPELARWLAQPGLVRTLVAVVTNVADGETPRPHLGFLAPAQRFRAKGAPGRHVVADPASFTGYDRFADAIASIDASAAVSTYHTLEPLFDAAYRELGHPEGGFRHGLDGALAALLAAPVPPANAELVPHAVGFRYADPKLEGLTAAQKQLLRIGPRNVPLVQAKLRELQAALGSTGSAPAAAGSPPPANPVR